MYIVLLVILILLCLGGLPHWSYAQSWGTGYYPSAALFVCFIVLAFLLLSGRIL